MQTINEWTFKVHDVDNRNNRNGPAARHLRRPSSTRPQCSSYQVISHVEVTWPDQHQQTRDAHDATMHGLAQGPMQMTGHFHTCRSDNWSNVTIQETKREKAQSRYSIKVSSICAHRPRTVPWLRWYEFNASTSACHTVCQIPRICFPRGLTSSCLIAECAFSRSLFRRSRSAMS